MNFIGVGSSHYASAIEYWLHCLLHLVGQAGGKAPPTRAAGDVCAIHAVMLEAEERMRESLAGRTLADIDTEVAGKLSDGIIRQTTAWFDDRNVNRRARAGRPARNKGT